MRKCAFIILVILLCIDLGCKKSALERTANAEDTEGNLRHVTDEFLDATKFHYRGEGIEVRVVGTELTGPRSQIIMNPNDIRYLVRLQIRNISDRAKLEYLPFGLPDGKHPVTLRDGFSNSYQLIDTTKHSWFGGRFRRESLYPGNMVEDVLAFEVPVQKADRLELTLPGRAIGVDSEIKFLVPATGFSAKQFDPTYHATITRMEYRQAEERKHEQRILQEKVRQAEQAQLKLEAEKKQTLEVIAKEKKLNEERERAEKMKLAEAQARIEQQNVEAEYKLAQEKKKADEKLRVAEEERKAQKMAEQEKAESEAARRTVRSSTGDLVVLGTSKFVIAEAFKNSELQTKLIKSGDLIILEQEADVSLVKAGVDYCEVMYKTKKYFVASKNVFEKK